MCYYRLHTHARAHTYIESEALDVDRQLRIAVKCTFIIPTYVMNYLASFRSRAWIRWGFFLEDTKHGQVSKCHTAVESTHTGAPARAAHSWLTFRNLPQLLFDRQLVSVLLRSAFRQLLNLLKWMCLNKCWFYTSPARSDLWVSTLHLIRLPVQLVIDERKALKYLTHLVLKQIGQFRGYGDFFLFEVKLCWQKLRWINLRKLLLFCSSVSERHVLILHKIN